MVTHHPMVHNVIASGAVGLVSFIGSVMTDSTHVPLGSAVAVGVFACTLTYWLSGRLQRIDDRIEAGEERNRQAFESLNKRLDSLPCDVRDCAKKP